jgi:hypothetical protein
MRDLNLGTYKGHTLWYYEEGGHNLFTLWLDDPKGENVWQINDFDEINSLFNEGFLAHKATPENAQYIMDTYLKKGNNPKGKRMITYNVEGRNLKLLIPSDATPRALVETMVRFNILRYIALRSFAKGEILVEKEHGYISFTDKKDTMSPPFLQLFEEGMGLKNPLDERERRWLKARIHNVESALQRRPESEDPDDILEKGYDEGTLSAYEMVLKKFGRRPKGNPPRRRIGQTALFYHEQQKIARGNETFLQMFKEGLTREELEALIKKRPSLWGRYERWLKILPSGGRKNPLNRREQEWLEKEISRHQGHEDGAKTDYNLGVQRGSKWAHQQDMEMFTKNPCAGGKVLKTLSNPPAMEIEDPEGEADIEGFVSAKKLVSRELKSKGFQYIGRKACKICTDKGEFVDGAKGVTLGVMTGLKDGSVFIAAKGITGNLPGALKQVWYLDKQKAQRCEPGGDAERPWVHDFEDMGAKVYKVKGGLLLKGSKHLWEIRKVEVKE